MKPLTPEDRDLLTRVLPHLTSPPVIQRVTDALLTDEYLSTYPEWSAGVPAFDRRVQAILCSPLASGYGMALRLATLHAKIEAAICQTQQK